MADIFDDFPKIENSRIIDNPDDYGSYYTDSEDEASIPGADFTDDYTIDDASMGFIDAEADNTAESFAEYDGIDEAFSDAENDDLRAEILSADEVEVIKDFPDTSTDIDIDLKFQRFIDYYLVCGNKKKAAKLAGFIAKNDDTLRVMASKAFKRPEVVAYYKLKKAEMAAKADIQRDAYMAELVSIATLDIADVVESHVIANTIEGEPVYVVTFKDMADIPLYARKAVKQIKINKDGSPEMIFYDKLAALKLLGEIKGYLTPDAGFDGDETDMGVAMIPSVLPDEE